MAMRAHPATSRNTTRVPVFALLGANSISQIGNMLTMVALPWFVLQTTGNPAKAGMVGFAVFLPGFAAGIFGGTLVDRLGFKRVSVLADGISGVGVATIPLLYHTVGLAFWQLLTLVFIGALLDVPGLTARRSMLPELTEHANMRLERVNAAFESINNLALLIGAPIAGLLIAWLGASNVLWLDAASFATSAMLIATLVPRPPLPTTPRVHGRYVEELMAGLRFIRREQLLFPMAIVLALSNGLSGSLFAIVLPVYTAEALAMRPISASWWPPLERERWAGRHCMGASDTRSRGRSSGWDRSCSCRSTIGCSAWCRHCRCLRSAGR